MLTANEVLCVPGMADSLTACKLSDGRITVVFSGNSCMVHKGMRLAFRNRRLEAYAYLKLGSGQSWKWHTPLSQTTVRALASMYGASGL